MAKLEDQVTPSEMLEIIRDGALKNEVMKRFRTSEQELAMMLLPLYRSGTLSKEEFNDFFKGVALRKPEEPESEKAREDEPPSAIFKALSDVHDRKVVEAAVKAAEEEEDKEAPVKEAPPKVRPKKAPPAEEAAEKETSAKDETERIHLAPAPPPPPEVSEELEAVEAEEEILVEEDLLEESEIFEDLDAIAGPGLEAEPEHEVPTEPIEHAASELEVAPPPPPEPEPLIEEAVPESLPVATEPPPAPAPEPAPAPAPAVEPPVSAEAPPPPAPPAPAAAPGTEPLFKAQGGRTIDSAGMTSFLEMIFAKLTSIENRLVRIEKKLGGS